jgi:hypothetical protein
MLMLVGGASLFLLQPLNHARHVLAAVASGAVRYLNTMTASSYEPGRRPDPKQLVAAAAGAAADGTNTLPFSDLQALEAHAERAWAHFRSLGSPAWHVAPMVDQVRGSGVDATPRDDRRHGSRHSSDVLQWG